MNDKKNLKCLKILGEKMIIKFKIYEAIRWYKDGSLEPRIKGKENDDINVSIIVPKISEDKKNSFWYKNGLVAEISNNNAKIRIFVDGEIMVRLKKNDFYRYNAIAVWHANEMGFNDEDLERLHDLGWLTNKKFRIEGTRIISSNYDDIIEKGIDYINKRENW
jgi:hypothetical protein